MSKHKDRGPKLAEQQPPPTGEPPKPPGRIKRDRIYLRYDFTKQELLDMAREIGRCGQRIAEKETELTAVKKDLQGQIEGYEAKRQTLSNHLASEFEMRNIDCEIRLHDPAPKKKSIVRVDTNAVVRIEDMAWDELQEEIDFDRSQREWAQAREKRLRETFDKTFPPEKQAAPEKREVLPGWTKVKLDIEKDHDGISINVTLAGNPPGSQDYFFTTELVPKDATQSDMDKLLDKLAKGLEAKVEFQTQPPAAEQAPAVEGEA